MEKKKEDIFKAFTAKAVQRLKDKKVTKYETLYVPSIDQNIKIRNLNYPEIVECTEIDDKQDPNASDKYCIYLAVVEPVHLFGDDVLEFVACFIVSAQKIDFHRSKPPV